MQHPFFADENYINITDKTAPCEQTTCDVKAAEQESPPRENTSPDENTLAAENTLADIGTLPGVETQPDESIIPAENVLSEKSTLYEETIPLEESEVPEESTLTDAQPLSEEKLEVGKGKDSDACEWAEGKSIWFHGRGRSRKFRSFLEACNTAQRL